MKILTQFADPEKIEVTISVTMAVEQWRLIHSRLRAAPYNAAAWEFIAAITDAVSAATAKATSQISERPNDETTSRLRESVHP